MIVNAASAQALEFIQERAADAARAFVPGARPDFGDVAAEAHSHAVPDPLSVVSDEDAYFVTSDDRGRTAYTQNGALQFADGKLVTSGGRPVLGFSDPGGTLRELHADPVDVALARTGGVRIDNDGTVAYSRESIDPRTGKRECERVVLGRLAVARFPAGTKLSAAGADRSIAPNGVVPHIGCPGDGTFGPLKPMRRQTSRIDLEASLSRLGDAYRAFDALQAAHKAQGLLGKTAMDLLK